MPKAQRPSDLKQMSGLRLRAARLVLGIDRQETFAELLGVTASAYGNWEVGLRLPDVAAMVRLWDLTGIGPNWIYAGSLHGVPFEYAQALEAKAAELGAVVGGAIPEWPMQVERKPGIAALRRPARVSPKRPPRATLHDPPASAE